MDVADKVIEIIEVNIRPELTGQVANWQPTRTGRSQ